MPDKKLYLFTTFNSRDQELINKLREEGKFVYHLRDYDEGDGFTIEHRVWVNNIGNLVTNWDILGDKKYLDCEDFFKLCVDVNATEVYGLKEVFTMHETNTIKFYQLYCGSDCTGPYKVTIEKPMTVRKFINDLLTQYPGEWGEIGIYRKGTLLDSPCREYKYGKLLRDFPEEYLDKEIEEVTGSGGWTYSSFSLHLKVNK